VKVDPGDGPIDLVEELVTIGDDVIRLLRPLDPAALIDEDAFAKDERLPYWAELWPSARALAGSLPASLAGRRILELGCGLALPSLVAARRGAAAVVATDWDHDALSLVQLNAQRNDALVSTTLVDWSELPDDLFDTRFDLVLAADVAYERRNLAPLNDLFERLSCEILLADPGRAVGLELLDRLTRHFCRTDLQKGVIRLMPEGAQPSSGPR